MICIALIILKEKQTMSDKKHLFAILQALFVTFLWSTSFVLIKYGLEEVSAITFAGLRYTIAATVLLAYMIFSGKLNEFKNISKRNWISLIMLGFIMYFLTQGAQYLGLYYLPAIQVSLFLNFTPLIILIFASRLLNEKPTIWNIVGVFIFLIGIVIYFFPLEDLQGEPVGYIIMTVGLISNAMATMLGRSVNKERKLSPILITTISMGIGGVLLLITGFSTEGFNPISIRNIGIIVFLAVVNTAVAFTLWNKTMQELLSIESSIINNTMLIQIAILSWLFLEEPFTFKTVISILIVSAGVLLVQFRKKVPKV
jgi:drug/metabolite transporter (DMT)-like permease